MVMLEKIKSTIRAMVDAERKTSEHSRKTIEFLAKEVAMGKMRERTLTAMLAFVCFHRNARQPKEPMVSIPIPVPTKVPCGPREPHAESR
jgi:hypothetical protein